MLNSKQADEPCGGRGDQGTLALAEEVLDHRRRLLEDADAGGHVAEQDGPQQPELRVLIALLAETFSVVTRDLLLTEAGSKPSDSSRRRARG